MRTVVLGPPPPELEALIARRHQSGLDKYDEVWDGDYHMAPMAHSSHGRIQAQVMHLLMQWADPAGLVVTGPFNLGKPDDFRVPDAGVHRTDPDAVWVPTAALVLEVVSPDDETWEKLPFYAGREVDEVVVVDVERRQVRWLRRDGDWFAPADSSALLGPGSAALSDLIGWPG
jgi:Uma2 family endonuclease